MRLTPLRHIIWRGIFAFPLWFIFGLGEECSSTLEFFAQEQESILLLLKSRSIFLVETYLFLFLIYF